ncbi:hypothetical protein PILCRDRAFT_830069 [Piloderma croceum F 1598]|uniref:Aminoglycoside phosphotransferase domain-containing protein n=1 Tax=Piloderma croceum (strain F 1598) TaxID=765440 RepID=A0A0C3EVR9_PILCF|nr:hypothetical protein PILCRDRAFT_830069 [Piloderma croceum F 1598]
MTPAYVHPTNDQVARQVAHEKAVLLWAEQASARQFTSPFNIFITRCQKSVFWRIFWAGITCLWRRTLGQWIYIKVTLPTYNPQAEVEAMRFVSQHTKTPVPRVWLHFQWLNVHYIFMSRIPGVPLVDVWSQLPLETKEAIVSQLAGYISQLRSIPPPPRPTIRSILGGSVQCFRLHDYDPSGPFRDEQHMNLQLRHLRPLDSFPDFVISSHTKTHPLVFTHNDLFPRNIMVDGCTVTGIMDWEAAGWFPAHWEYCKSKNWGDWRPEHALWSCWVSKFIPVFEEEARADKWLLNTLYSPSKHAI